MRIARIAYAATALGFVLAFFRVHQLAAFNFPVPWLDESDILWRSIAFAKTGSLTYAPQLFFQPHYNRVPGYMFFVGVLFSLWECSLYVARLASCGLVITSFLMLARMTARYRFPLLSLVILGAFLLSKMFVVTGNIGRMEPLLLCVACLGFMLLQRGHDLPALAVTLMGPLIHPNGLYFVIAVGLYLFVTRIVRVEGRRLSRAEAAVLLVAVAVWCAYGMYVGLHWQATYTNMKSQWGIKLSRDIRGHLLTTSNVEVMLAALACGAYSWRKHLAVGFLLALAIPAWLLYGVGQEMWYQVFNHLFYALFSIVGVEVLVALIDQLPIAIVARLRYAVASVLTAGFLLWNYQGGGWSIR